MLVKFNSPVRQFDSLKLYSTGIRKFNICEFINGIRFRLHTRFSILRGIVEHLRQLALGGSVVYEASPPFVQITFGFRGRVLQCAHCIVATICLDCFVLDQFFLREIPRLLPFYIFLRKVSTQILLFWAVRSLYYVQIITKATWGCISSQFVLI